MTPRNTDPQAPGDGYHVVTLYRSEEGHDFGHTKSFTPRVDAKAYFAAQRRDADAGRVVDSPRGPMVIRAVWLYEINPLDGRREEMDAVAIDDVKFPEVSVV